MLVEWRRTHVAWLGIVALLSMPSVGAAQTFTKITTGNPIATDPVPATADYTGCAWADYDADGDQDLYIVQQGLYRNDGAGVFTHLFSITDLSDAIGCSWADADNDGDLDLYVSGGGSGGSYLYRNDGGDSFTRITTGVIGDTFGNQGWGCAWGDYDNDGLTDLFVAAAFGFNGITTTNHLLHNEGGLTFTRIDTSTVATATGPYTIPSWNDWDDDGDADLFVASGPADGTVAPDFLYENRGGTPGVSFFRRITTGVMATDAHDGQAYNWVDVDADGDLDVYLTNDGFLQGGLPNDLYRNDAGVFVKMTGAQAGAIVTDEDASLASVWADFDNDGDMDCVVTNEGGDPTRFYTNDGSGFFTSNPASALATAGPHFGAAAADYDGDGDVDIYIHGRTLRRGLFRNESGTTNAWLDVHCVGTVSNRAAIGARVWVRATIGGVSRRLVQLISAQNSFAGHNALDLHFGLGNATIVDSVIVLFPSGRRMAMAGVATRQRMTVVEDAATAVTVSLVSAEATAERARVVWRLGEPRSARVAVERRTEASDWVRVGEVLLDGDDQATFEDHDVVAGARYGYRIAVSDAEGDRWMGEVWLDVPGSGDVRVDWTGGNPAGNRMQVAVTLPSGGDARLDVLDVSGRVIGRHDLTGLPPGRSTVDLGPNTVLASGVYWVRLTHGTIVRATRVAILR